MDALLDLNLFEEYRNEFFSQFDGHALSLDDFVQCWKEMYGTEMHGANTWNQTCTCYIYVLCWDQYGANNGGKELTVK